MERTLILVKPDAFARNLTGEIIARFENKGLRIAALKHMQVTEDLAKQHYAEHEGKPFFGELVDFITSGPLVAMVLEGTEAVTAARQVIGATNPLEASPGSIRGDFAIEVGKNRLEALGEVEEAADLLRYYAQTMEDNDGYDHPMDNLGDPTVHTRSILRPHGVFAVVSPFNFPMALATGPSSAAMMAGNTVVIKPASASPLSAQACSSALLSACSPWPRPASPRHCRRWSTPTTRPEMPRAPGPGECGQPPPAGCGAAAG